MATLTLNWTLITVHDQHPCWTNSDLLFSREIWRRQGLYTCRTINTKLDSRLPSLSVKDTTHSIASSHLDDFFPPCLTSNDCRTTRPTTKPPHQEAPGLDSSRPRVVDYSTPSKYSKFLGLVQSQFALGLSAITDGARLQWQLRPGWVVLRYWASCVQMGWLDFGRVSFGASCSLQTNKASTSGSDIASYYKKCHYTTQ